MTKMVKILVLGFCVSALGVTGCKKSDSPTDAPAPPSLNAAPTSVTVTVGGSQSVSISGGTPPYSIASAPGAIATATLVRPDSVVASVLITGVSVASVSTAVTIKDNSPSPAKQVAIPIKVQ